MGGGVQTTVVAEDIPEQHGLFGLDAPADGFVDALARPILERNVALDRHGIDACGEKGLVPISKEAVGRNMVSPTLRLDGSGRQRLTGGQPTLEEFDQLFLGMV